MPFVYILANTRKTVLYVGSTIDIENRMKQHLNKFYKNSFSSRYNVFNLVYLEYYEYLYEARSREYQIKNGSRKRKVLLITKTNPNWISLYPQKWQKYLGKNNAI